MQKVCLVAQATIHQALQKQFQLPAAVAFVSQQGASAREIFCSGVPLSQDVIVTAGHCLARWSGIEEDSAHLFVSTPSSETSIPIQRWSLHPNYLPLPKKDTEDFDLAIVKLREPIPLVTHWSIPRELQTDGSQPKFWFKGFSPVRLKERNSSTLMDSTSTWTEVAKASELVREGKISVRAVNGQTGACPGDSGAPLWKFTESSALLEGMVIQANCEKGDVKVLSFKTYWSWIESSLRKFNSADSFQALMLNNGLRNLFADARKVFSDRE